jgi:hypothetical protein
MDISHKENSSATRPFRLSLLAPAHAFLQAAPLFIGDRDRLRAGDDMIVGNHAEAPSPTISAISGNERFHFGKAR